jgi:hypothetical protein
MLERVGFAQPTLRILDCFVAFRLGASADSNPP